MADWDLTAKIGPYLDRHLVFPLLEFLSAKEYYDETDLLRGKLDSPLQHQHGRLRHGRAQVPLPGQRGAQHS